MAQDTLLTGKKFRTMVCVGARCLENNKEPVNDLNVFPVPDGDTGTNMCLTMSAAVREMERVTSTSLGEMVKALSLGSLMGARGNSGVILSQFFRGWSKSLQEYRTATALQVAWAMQEGVETAYKAVMKPVEGTILTVAREMAKASLQTAKKGASLEETLAAGLARGHEVLAATPEMLPVLKQAGVVDAGGAGLLWIIEGLVLGLRGEDVVAVTKPSARPPVQPEVADLEAPDQEIVFAYDTQFLIKGTGLGVNRIRGQLEPLGDSLLVVGDTRMVKVHVHTNEPHKAIAIGLEHGELVEASVENMRQQHEAVRQAKMAAASPDGAGTAVMHHPHAPIAHGVVESFPVFTPAEPGTAPEGSGIVVVSAGPGIEQIFRNLGADGIVNGGQTMNPSTEDILRALETLPHSEIIILPNNGNILLAARQTAELTSKQVRVVASKSIPQGISALMAFNRGADLDRNWKRMEQATKAVKSGEVTYAVRDSRYKDLEIHEGDFIGLLDDEIVTTGPDARSVLTDLIERTTGEDTEVVTVFYGEDVSDEIAAETGEQVRRLIPEHEVEVHRGGQPLYHYLLSVE